jgi:chromosome partitioning protein
MAVISMISPKGGAGKTTAAVILATELARSNSVALIDADPNQPIKEWGALGDTPANLTIIDSIDKDKLTDTIEQASKDFAFVIVDCEGRADVVQVYAVGMSDFVLIPTQGSQLDARQAAKALKIIREAARLQGAEKDHAIVLTRTNPTIKTRNLTYVAEQLGAAGVPILKTELNEREAFRSMFSYGGGLDNLPADQVANIDKAKTNARAFANEVAAKFIQKQKGKR